MKAGFLAKTDRRKVGMREKRKEDIVKEVVMEEVSMMEEEMGKKPRGKDREKLMGMVRSSDEYRKWL